MTEENKVILDTDKLPNFADTFIDINTYKRLEQENNSLQVQLNNITVQSNNAITALEQENKELKKIKGRCAFKCLDNTFCDEARIKIDKLELDRDCLNVSLETARKYRGIAEVERDKYRSTLEEIREIADIAFVVCDNECGNARNYAVIKHKIDEALK